MILLIAFIRWLVIDDDVRSFMRTMRLNQGFATETCLIKIEIFCKQNRLKASWDIPLCTMQTGTVNREILTL